MISPNARVIIMYGDVIQYCTEEELQILESILEKIRKGKKEACKSILDEHIQLNFDREYEVDFR